MSENQGFQERIWVHEGDGSPYVPAVDDWTPVWHRDTISGAFERPEANQGARRDMTQRKYVRPRPQRQWSR